MALLSGHYGTPEYASSGHLRRHNEKGTGAAPTKIARYWSPDYRNGA